MTAGQPQRPSWPPLVLSTALCVLMAVLVSVLAQRDAQARQTDRARHGALASAARIVRDVLSYDFRTIDADIARAQRDTTGEFAAQYNDAATELRSRAIANRAIVQAQPQPPGVVSANARQVTLLLFVDQVSVRQLPGASSPLTRATQSRVQMTLTEVDGTWRLSALSGL